MIPVSLRGRASWDIEQANYFECPLSVFFDGPDVGNPAAFVDPETNAVGLTLIPVIWKIVRIAGPGDHCQDQSLRESGPLCLSPGGESIFQSTSLLPDYRS